MAKTNPIGVRFDSEILETIKKEQDLKTPQQVLNYLMDVYNSVPVGKQESGSTKQPPKELSGIALKIWQEEQKLKQQKNGK